MNPKKPVDEKAKNSGISLEPDLINEAKRYAKDHGYKGISGLARFLLIQKLSETSQSLRKSGNEDLAKAKEKKSKGAKKIKDALKK